jgi:2-haloalkanoic acid dehalogenase type II
VWAVPTFKLLTFDCYGTLIDWETGIRRAIESVADQASQPIDAERLYEAYLRHEAAIEAKPYRPYAQVLQDAAVAAGAELGLPETLELRRALVDSLPHWRPFDDALPSLKRLATRYRLGILSNVDRRLLAATLKWLPVSFDLIVTAEDVRSYKPASGHFEAMLARAACPKSDVLHVAQSHSHDVTPCSRLGITCAWINRRGESYPDGPRASFELPNLSALCDHLAA